METNDERSRLFVERLQELMNEKKLTQVDLARMGEVTQPTVSRWLKGAVPQPLRAKILADALGVNWRWLTKGSLDADPQSPRGRLRSAMHEAGLDSAQLAKRIGYGIGVIQHVVDGAGRASEKMIEAICRELPTLSKEDLMEGSEQTAVISETGTEGTYGSKPKVRLPPGSKGKLVPVLSWAQAGRYQIGHTDEAYGFMAELAIDVEDPRAFCIIIDGDSMVPAIGPGDKVIVCPDWPVQAGDTVIAKTKEGDVYCKLLQRTSGKVVHLASVNPAHPPIDIPRDEIEWIYPVAEVHKKLRRK